MSYSTQITTYPAFYAQNSIPPQPNHPLLVQPTVNRPLYGTPPTSSASSFLPVSQPSTAPSTTIVGKEQLTHMKALQKGLQSGLIFSSLAALPIYLLERQAKSENLVQSLLKAVGHSQGANQLSQNPRALFLSSIAGTLFIGLSAGPALGIWLTNRVRNKFSEIQMVKQQQQQGIFAQKPLTWLQSVGLSEKPITDPNQAFQELMNQELNEKEAFKKGTMIVLLFKVVPTIIILLTCFALLKVLPQKEASALMQRLKASLKASIHPVIFAKAAALPFMGGFIAKSLVPWMRNQLGLPASQNQAS